MHMVYFALYIWCKITLNFVILEQALGGPQKKNPNSYVKISKKMFTIIFYISRHTIHNILLGMG